MILLTLRLSLLSILSSTMALIIFSLGGESPFEAVTTEDAQGRVAVRFTNRGTLQGFRCGWINATCTGSAKQTVHICADDVAPNHQTAITTNLQTGGRASCQVSFLPNDTVN